MTREQRIHLDNIERTQKYTLRENKIRVLKHQEQEYIERRNRSAPLLTVLSIVYLIFLGTAYLIR